MEVTVLTTLLFASSALASGESCTERHFCSCPPFLADHSDTSPHTGLHFTKHTYTDHFAIVGKSKELHCCVAPNFTRLEWTKDDVPFPWEQERNSVLYSRNQSLILLDVRPSDAGYYRCTARMEKDGVTETSSGDQVTDQVEVISHVAQLESFPSTVFSHQPVWNKPPEDVVAAVGETATFSCSATVGQQYNSVSMQPVQAAWVRFGQEMESGGGTRITQRWTDDDIVTHIDLVLSSVSEDHGGNYTCRVVNNYGSLEKTVVLEVVQTGQGQQVGGDGVRTRDVEREVKAVMKKQMKIFRSLAKLAATQPKYFAIALKELEKKMH